MARMADWLRTGREKTVCLYSCVLVGVFIVCGLVHAVLCSVAAEKQHCFLMKIPFNKDPPMFISPVLYVWPGVNVKLFFVIL